jgi:drug/metabolite transporter (DMT)-like permease
MNRRAWIAFIAVSVLWGMPYLFIRIALEGGLPALFLAWMRIALAAAVVGAMAWRAGVLGSLRGRWRPIVAYAIPEIAIPFPMIAWGEKHVASSLAAILVSTVPLIIAVLALRFDHAERPDRRRTVGLLLGFAGVVALVGIDIAGRPAELVGAAAILLAAVGYAVGPLIFKHRLADLDGRATMAASLAIAAIILTPAGLLDLPKRAPSAGALAALAVLVLFCTVAGFLIFLTLIREVGPGKAAVIAYVAPILAVGLGVVVLGEHPGVGALGGLVLILAGSWLATGGRLGPARKRPVVPLREQA